MFRRGLAVQAFIVTVSCTAVLAPGATATPLQLLPLKACNFVMTGADFNDGLEQVQLSHTSSYPGDDGELTQCAYASTAADGAGLSRSFPEEPPPPAMPTGLESTPPSLVKECEANLTKLDTPENPYAPFEAPATGGCYSSVIATVTIFVGSKVQAAVRHLGPNPHNYRDRATWPAGVSRSVLRTFGAYAGAELGYGTAEVSPLLGPYQVAYGYLHVKNAVITIEEKDSPPRAPTSMLTLLDDAKHML